MASALRDAGVRVHVFSDEDHTRPDSVFPNNWLSTPSGGYVGVYPMYASNRRHERRIPTIELAGGSVRCMIAGVHLDRRPTAEPEFSEAVEAIDENPVTADGRDVVDDPPAWATAQYVL